MAVLEDTVRNVSLFQFSEGFVQNGEGFVKVFFGNIEGRLHAEQVFAQGNDDESFFIRAEADFESAVSVGNGIPFFIFLHNADGPGHAAAAIEGHFVRMFFFQPCQFLLDVGAVPFIKGLEFFGLIVVEGGVACGAGNGVAAQGRGGPEPEGSP